MMLSEYGWLVSCSLCAIGVGGEMVITGNELLFVQCSCRNLDHYNISSLSLLLSAPAS